MGMDGEGMYEGKIEVWLRLTTSRLWLRLWLKAFLVRDSSARRATDSEARIIRTNMTLFCLLFVSSRDI